MKLISLLLFLVLNGAHAAPFDESVGHAPDFQIYQYDPKLLQKYGEEGDHLCWDSSLAHRMMYFQSYRKPGFPNLHLEKDPVSNVQKFINSCHTNPKGGTSQARKIPCIVSLFKESHYKGHASWIGPNASEKKYRRSVKIEDLQAALRKDEGVILHIGWLRFDSKTHSWTEKGSHSVNAYGFDWNQSWGSKRIVLQIANPGVDYSSRSPKQWFDSVELKKLDRDPAARYPAAAAYVLTGPGFDSPGRLALLEDAFIFSPE